MGDNLLYGGRHGLQAQQRHQLCEHVSWFIGYLKTLPQFKRMNDIIRYPEYNSAQLPFDLTYSVEHSNAISRQTD
jgi:hypothetical protein